MVRPIARTLILAALLVFVAALVAQARPLTRRAFVSAYPKTAGTRLDACITCHAPDGVSLNPYGAALMKSGVNFQSIERLDSDGDGVSNRLEILGLAFPGDAKDRPGAKRDSAAADSARGTSQPSRVLRPDTSEARPDTSGARPDTMPRRPAPPDSGGARPDTLKPPKHG